MSAPAPGDAIAGISWTDPDPTTFSIADPVLARGMVQRWEDLRTAERAAESWPAARVLRVDATGRVLVDRRTDPPALVTEAAPTFGDRPEEHAVLLGRVGDVDHWAVPDLAPGVDAEVSWNEPVPQADLEWLGLREIGAALSDTDAALLTTAVALVAWHRRAAFCPRCGVGSRPSTAGWARVCGNGHEEFPRTDPAVIVLVHDGADGMVLARQPVWPPGRMSVLAGFVEAGESLEATVGREIAEEIGVTVRDFRYLGSQPWPFPRSLMIGFAARADRGAPLVPRPGEIEAATWVDREQVRRILAAGGSAEGITLPPAVSIARRMVEGWAGWRPPVAS